MRQHLPTKAADAGFPILATLWLLLFLAGCNASANTGSLPWKFDIFSGKAISKMNSFNISVVRSPCYCKRKCYMLPRCKSWSVSSVINDEKECRLADNYPQVEPDETAVFGVYLEGSPSYTPAPPTTTTTTTIDPTTYELRFFKENNCSPNRLIWTVAIAPGDTTGSHLKNTVCFKAKISPSFTVDDSIEELVATGPEVPSQMCSGNKVLVGFMAFEEYNADLGIYRRQVAKYSNPQYLKGVCHLLQNWVVDTNTCETLSPETGKWSYEVSLDFETDAWDYYFSCEPFWLAVQLTRELVDGSYKVVSMTCCKIKA